MQISQPPSFISTPPAQEAALYHMGAAVALLSRALLLLLLLAGGLRPAAAKLQLLCNSTSPCQPCSQRELAVDPECKATGFTGGYTCVVGERNASAPHEFARDLAPAQANWTVRCRMPLGQLRLSGPGRAAAPSVPGRGVAPVTVARGRGARQRASSPPPLPPTNHPCRTPRRPARHSSRPTPAARPSGGTGARRGLRRQ